MTYQRLGLFRPALRLYDMRRCPQKKATNKTGKKWRWPEALSDELLAEFAEMFPNDLMEKLGYA